MSIRIETLSMSRLLLSLLLALSLCLVLGCGGRNLTPTVFPLEGGFVWHDGQDAGELEGCTVEFESSGNVAAKATILADGTFTLDSLLPQGQYRVRVVPASGAKITALAPRYQKFESSGLTANGSSEPQQVKFKLTKVGS